MIKMRPKTIIIDIDGTVCTQEEDYKDAKPYLNRIYKVNSMYAMGNEIIFFTARGTETGIDWRKVTEKQLKSWGVRYHKLIFGKPAGDLYIDNLAVDDNFLGEK